MTLVDIELRRARWRRTLARYGLDETQTPDFTARGLATRLETPTVQLLLLPSDPESNPISFNSQFWTWTKEHEVVDLGTRKLRLGTYQIPTADAGALVYTYGKHERWNSYIAVHRCGAIEYGLGNLGGWQRDRDGERVRLFHLISIVARTWALLRLTDALRQEFPIPAPYQLTVAAYGTEGALLGNLGSGWAEPHDIFNEVGGCQHDQLLWHFELDSWPTDDNQREIAYQVGDRFEDAWGLAERRYLDHDGDRAGTLDLRRVPE